MKTFSGRNPSQNEWELESFISLLLENKVGWYLEIGARHGDTFHAVMSALPVGSLGVAIDLPGGAWGVESSQASLHRAADDLRAKGYDIEVLIGDSQSPEIIREFRRSFGDNAFDAILIDGDHRYEGVKADWLNYREAANGLVAFHDIAGHGLVQRATGYPVEVPRLWAELKPQFETIEYIAPGSKMGIGVLCRN